MTSNTMAVALGDQCHIVRECTEIITPNHNDSPGFKDTILKVKG